MPTKNKEKKIADFVESLEKSKIAFTAEYQGLTVEQVSVLRRQLKEVDSEMKIMKNTLAKRALTQIGYDDMVDSMVGPLAFFLGYETAVHAPKVVFGFAKENQNLVVKNGYYFGKLVDAALLKELADLPPMSELRIKFYQTVASPPMKFLRTAKAPLTQFVTTLDALVKKREETGN